MDTSENLQQPLVTIAMAVFNGRETLATALESCAAQTYPRCEILISDDGSTDGSLEMCREFADTTPGCRLVQNESRLGLVGNYNQLIGLARGKYLVFADQDDRREPGFVASCVEVLEKYPDSVLCHSHTGVVWPGITGSIYHINTLDSVDGVAPPVRRYWSFLRHYSDTAIYGLIRIDALRRTHIWQEGLGSSNRLLFELLLIGTFRQVPETLHWYTAKGLKNRPRPAEEFARQTGGRQLSRFNVPFLALAGAQTKAILTAPRTPLEKFGLIFVLWWHVFLVNSAKLTHRTLSMLTRGHVPAAIERRCADLVYPTDDLRFVVRPEDDHDYYPEGWPLHRS